MKVNVNDLKIGDIVANVPFSKLLCNARVTEIMKVYEPVTFKEINAVVVKLFCVRDNGTTFHASLKLPDNSEWELIYREDETEDVG